MASGLASRTRFTGILVSVAALGAVLSDVARDRFVAGATNGRITRNHRRVRPSVPGRLDAFKTEFETKFAHPVVLAVMHRATEELIALGQAQPAGVMTDSIQSLTQRSLARPRCGM